jgi:LacI family transcriptional regulator
MVLLTDKPNVTLIARRCGLSKMTVSRVLRNFPNVSPPTRDLILKTAQKMGFKPSRHAHEKQATVTTHYYILFQQENSIQDAYFREIILSVQNQLFERGYGCSLGIIHKEYSEFLKLSQILRQREIRGVLIVGDIPRIYAETLQMNFSNLVFIDYPGDSTLRKPYNSAAICMDNVYGGYLAMNHLLDLGRRRILLVGGRKDHYFTMALLQAYRGSLGERQIEIDPHRIVYGDFHVESGFNAVWRAIKSGIEFDAIFTNDEMACGALKALHQAKLRVPHDIAVVGFDGLPIGQMVSPTLTTIMVDREKMGRLAVERLMEIEQREFPEDTCEKISLFPRLIIRESCGAAPQDIGQ